MSNFVRVTSRFVLAIVVLAMQMIVFDSWSAAADPALPTNKLTDEEKAAGWKLLFDGETPTGWRGLGRDDFPSCWVVKDGCLKCTGGTKDANDLVAVDKYENFELAFEWLFAGTKGNSGVKYRVQEKKGQGYAFGCEYQCYQDPKLADIHAPGSLYDVIAPTANKLALAGEFNKSKIVVNGQHVEHWLNGTKVVDTEFFNKEMNAALAKSHFKGSDWGKQPLGYIVLQDHHSEVSFRNIKIRVLPTSTSK